MKCLKMLGLAVVAAMALVALLGAASASATVLCTENKIPCPATEDYEFNTEIEMSPVSSFVVKSTNGTVFSTCAHSTIKGRTENTGGKGAAVKVEVTELAFAECTNKITTTVLGRLTIEYIRFTNTVAEMRIKNTQVTVSSIFGSCVYGAAESPGTPAGLLTGATMTGVGTFHGKAVFSKVEGSALCPADVTWEDQYTITKPTQLYFKEETA